MRAARILVDVAGVTSGSTEEKKLLANAKTEGTSGEHGEGSSQLRLFLACRRTFVVIKW